MRRSGQCRRRSAEEVRPPVGTAADWVQANIAYTLQHTTASPSGPTAGSTRLPELLLVEVLRLHLATAPAVDHGWTAALTDPVLAPALALLHRAPDHKWTVSELARAATVSRSLLDGRFRQVLGLSPIRYLTEWRMRVARQARAARLRVTDDLAVLPRRRPTATLLACADEPRRQVVAAIVDKFCVSVCDAPITTRVFVRVARSGHGRRHVCPTHTLGPHACASL